MTLSSRNPRFQLLRRGIDAEAIKVPLEALSLVFWAETLKLSRLRRMREELLVGCKAA